MSSTWEDQIALNSSNDAVHETVGPAANWTSQEKHPRFVDLAFEEALINDPYPLPSTKGREGYYGDSHFNYWLSGLKDSEELIKVANSKPMRHLDLGGASGRVARHMLLQHDTSECYIADINRLHVNFVLNIFEGRIKAFQSSSIPHLPIEDNYFDLISAFSVFSHIETFDETWLLELRRILRPGGEIIFTANVDTFQDIDSTWPVYKALANHPEFDKASFGKPLRVPRQVVRWNNSGSYSSIVYMTKNYVTTRWAPFFSDFQIYPYFTQYQTGIKFVK